MTPEQEIQLIISNPLYFFDSIIFLIFQILSGITSLAILGAAAYFWWKGGSFQRHVRHLMIAWNANPIPAKKMIKRWNAIAKLLEGDDPTVWRAAIVEADNMLDEVLKKLGYDGANMDERLENIHVDQFPSLAEAWRAHSIRKFIGEDLAYQPTREVVDKTFDIYRDIFRETGLTL